MRPFSPRLQLVAKWAGIYAATGLFVVGLGTAAGELAARCQCHYTPALFAEREGLRRFELDVKVAESDRRAFIERLEGVNVFVDPTYQNGASSRVAVFAAPAQIGAVRQQAARIAQSLR